jgi:hypothetical protein
VVVVTNDDGESSDMKVTNNIIDTINNIIDDIIDN